DHYALANLITILKYTSSLLSFAMPAKSYFSSPVYIGIFDSIRKIEGPYPRKQKSQNNFERAERANKELLKDAPGKHCCVVTGNAIVLTSIEAARYGLVLAYFYCGMRL